MEGRGRPERAAVVLHGPGDVRHRPGTGSGMTTHRPAPPDFVVIGAYRSGTTLLYRALGSHPDAFLPAVKEPNWFAVCGGVDVTPELRARSVLSWDHYASLFDDAGPHQLRGDASPEYLRNPVAAGNI